MLILLGVAVLLLLWGGLTAFRDADVRSIKALVRWAVGLGGILLAMLLVLTGRGALALFALTMLGPAVWNWWRGGPVSPGTASVPRGAMTRAEALEVLGLSPGASSVDIKAAHLRLMRAAHPDSGGSDWLASRINQARDVLLG